MLAHGLFIAATVLTCRTRLAKIAQLDQKKAEPAAAPLVPHYSSSASRTSMLAKSVQLGLSRYAGCATMADSPCGRGRTPSTDAHRGQPFMCYV
eukprot:3680230-Alexandrium_andersonii.AAC.1